MRFFILIVSLIFYTNLYSQNILLENFGNLQINTNVNLYTGYTNPQRIGFEGTGLIRRVAPTSSGAYINASGFNYVLLRSNQFIKTKEIIYQNQCEGDLLLFFGLSGAFSNIQVQYSIDNINFSNAFMIQSKDTITWRVLESTIPYFSPLYLRFNNVGTTEIKIDDINLISPCPLPVTLEKFYGLQEDFNNNLYWKISSGNIKHFEIQRSISDLKFETINFVNFDKNIFDYSYMDNSFDPTQNIYYYRLKNVEFDGRFEYSDIISIENNIGLLDSYTIGMDGRIIPEPNITGTYFKISIFQNGFIKKEKKLKLY